MSYGSGPYGGEPYGGGGTLFAVLGAIAINPFTVVITFTAPPDLTAPTTQDVANYDFDGTVQALQIVADPDPNSLRVITTEQDYQLYTVTVSPDVEGLALATVDPLYNEATFTGFPSAARFSARPISAIRVNLVFHQPMVVNANLSDPSNYTLQTVDGAPIAVFSATPNQLVDATRVVLQVASLTSGIPYSLAVSPNVTASGGKMGSSDAHWRPRRITAGRREEPGVVDQPAQISIAARHHHSRARAVPRRGRIVPPWRLWIERIDQPPLGPTRRLRETP